MKKKNPRWNIYRIKSVVLRAPVAWLIAAGACVFVLAVAPLMAAAGAWSGLREWWSIADLGTLYAGAKSASRRKPA